MQFLQILQFQSLRLTNGTFQMLMNSSHIIYQASHYQLIVPLTFMVFRAIMGWGFLILNVGTLMDSSVKNSIIQLEFLL